jgi:hypothetical protein
MRRVFLLVQVLIFFISIQAYCNFTERDSIKRSDFDDFINGFNDIKFPFDLRRDLSINSYIRSNLVDKFIDPEYSKKDSLDLIEAGDYDNFYKTYYFPVSKSIRPNYIMIIHCQLVGGVGIRGDYTIALYNKEGGLLDTIIFDAYDICGYELENVIIFKDSIISERDKLKRIFSIKNRRFEEVTKEINSHIKGNYPQASLRFLSIDALKKLTYHDLKIMRNEIFARYGYIFKEGGEMDKYFKSQDWYSPQHKNVNNFLTEIEKANLKLIREVEAE